MEEYHAIVAAPIFSSFSFEELRWQDLLWRPPAARPPWLPETGEVLFSAGVDDDVRFQRLRSPEAHWGPHGALQAAREHTPFAPFPAGPNPDQLLAADRAQAQFLGAVRNRNAEAATAAAAPASPSAPVPFALQLAQAARPVAALAAPGAQAAAAAPVRPPVAPAGLVDQAAAMHLFPLASAAAPAAPQLVPDPLGAAARAPLHFSFVPAAQSVPRGSAAVPDAAAAPPVMPGPLGAAARAPLHFSFVPVARGVPSAAAAPEYAVVHVEARRSAVQSPEARPSSAAVVAQVASMGFNTQAAMTAAQQLKASLGRVPTAEEIVEVILAAQEQQQQPQPKPQPQPQPQQQQQEARSSGGSPPGAEGAMCSVCMEKESDAAMVPCGHAQFCLGCAQAIADREPRLCPVCRVRIESVLRLYRG
eukprot:m51a1_g1991 hypothetical protein (419) ;mRNA; f:1193005-1194815